MRDKRVVRDGAAANRRRRPAEPEGPIDELGLLQKAGEFEAATGFPHGPIAVVGAIVTALLLRPLRRALRAFLRG